MNIKQLHSLGIMHVPARMKHRELQKIHITYNDSVIVTRYPKDLKLHTINNDFVILDWYANILNYHTLLYNHHDSVILARYTNKNDIF